MYQDFDKKLYFFFHNLIYQFGNNPSLLEFFLNDHPKKFKEKLLKNKIQLSHFLKISERIGISIDHILSDAPPWKEIKEKFLRTPWSIPQEYLDCAGTKISVLQACLAYVRCKFNIQTEQALLDHLHLTRECFTNDQIQVNVLLVNKFFRFCSSKLNFTPLHFRELSYLCYQINNRHQILQLAKTFRSDESTLRLMVVNSTKYESNFEYSLKKNDNILHVSSLAKQDIHDGLKLKELTTPEVVLFKKFTMECTTVLMGKRPMNIINVKTSFHKGRQKLDFYLKENNLRGHLNIIS
ncbi:MAG: hypothetical protein QE271_03475 [Bacteriovoracaceae bacterium]|nr:hypothetical protein [Bacteriovoracaceae bacterium]